MEHTNPGLHSACTEQTQHIYGAKLTYLRSNQTYLRANQGCLRSKLNLFTEKTQHILGANPAYLRT